jgi:pyrroline-5-carboxylate reductase
MKNTIGFIGAGNMGGAIIAGLLADKPGMAPDIFVSDYRKEALNSLEMRFPGIHVSTDNALTAAASIVILAVKPQVHEEVIREIRDKVSAETVVVTIAAGLTLEKVAAWFGKNRRIIRTMPNTPALVARGMTALCPGPNADASDMQRVENIFKAVGKTVVLPEHLMDAYTSLAGSSPAWVFMFLEALADGAVREGMPRNLAYEIAAQAVLGSAALAAESGEHPGILKDRVCSPGGTTIEGVATLEKAGFRSAVIQAVADCTARAKELGAR